MGLDFDHPSAGLLAPPDATATPAQDFDALVRNAGLGLRRRWAVIVICFLGVTLASAIFILDAPRVFVATTSLLIDPRQGGARAPTALLLNSDELIVDSEIEVIRSEAMARRVVAALDLINPGAQTPYRPTIVAKALDQLGALLGQPPQPPLQMGLSDEEIAMRKAARTLLGNLDVVRKGATYVIDISVKNKNPAMAAEIANRYAQEYISANIDVQVNGANQLNAQLLSALDQIADRFKASQDKVAQFRLENGIVVAGGRQVAEQELNAVNDALVSVRQQSLRIGFSLKRLETFLAAGDLSDGLRLDNAPETIRALRVDISDAQTALAQLEARRGAGTPEATQIQAGLTASFTRLEAEYAALKRSLEAQLGAAREEETALAQRAADLRADVTDIANKENRLAELKIQAEGERQMYAQLVNRHQETVSAGNFTSSNARVITPATIPTAPISPRRTLTVAAGAFAGLMLGLGLAFLIEQLDRRMRSPDDVQALGLPYFGAVPHAGRSSRARMRRLGWAATRPRSVASETLRSAAFAIRRRTGGDRSARIVGVVSCQPKEGKTMLAMNLALLLADQGQRVCLLDLSSGASPIGKVLGKAGRQINLDSVLSRPDAPSRYFGETGARLFEGVAVFSRFDGARDCDDLGPDLLDDVLAAARRDFDIVILDTSALAHSSNAKAAAMASDDVILAVRWGKVSEFMVRQVLDRCLQDRTRVLGVIYTLGRLSQIRRYDRISFGKTGVFQRA